MAISTITSASTTGVITSGTAVASTSGTSIDFTSIPSWVKRITVMFNGVSLSGSANYLVQLGTSSGIDSTNYISQSTISNTGSATTNSTSGFIIYDTVAAVTNSGCLVINNMGNNIWAAFGVFTLTTNGNCTASGSKTLSSVLDRVRITTSNGTDTFDAGSINILYE